MAPNTQAAIDVRSPEEVIEGAMGLNFNRSLLRPQDQKDYFVWRQGHGHHEIPASGIVGMGLHGTDMLRVEFCSDAAASPDLGDKVYMFRTDPGIAKNVLESWTKTRARIAEERKAAMLESLCLKVKGILNSKAGSTPGMTPHQVIEFAASYVLNSLTQFGEDVRNGGEPKFTPIRNL